MKKLLLLLIWSFNLSAQEIDIFNKDHKLIETIEEQKVDERIQQLEDGVYYLQEYTGGLYARECKIVVRDGVIINKTASV